MCLLLLLVLVTNTLGNLVLHADEPLEAQVITAGEVKLYMVDPHLQPNTEYEVRISSPATVSVAMSLCLHPSNQWIFT